MNDLKGALFSIFPRDRVSDDPAVLAGYAADSATLPGASTSPCYVVLPKTTDEVVHLVQVADRARVPLVPMARGSNIAGMSVSVQGGYCGGLQNDGSNPGNQYRIWLCID
jgi:glycolate oxidase